VDVLAYRVAAQGLAARDRTPVQVAASFGLQDSPRGAALTAVAARSERAEELAGALEARELVAVPNPRTAVAILPAEDVATYLAALRPPDEAALKTVFLRAVPGDYEASREKAVVAVGDALDGRVLSRDDLHEELRGRLPAEMLPWCEPCQSHHARRGVLTVAALAGRLCYAGQEGRQPTFARTDQWMTLPPAEPRASQAELARRYLHHLGPSTHGDLAAWAGISIAHAKALLKTIEDELVAVGKAVLLADDLPALEDPPAARGVRLLGAGDPLLGARDKERLIPNKDLRKRIWKMIGSPGIVLSDGRPVGTWRARKQGSRLSFETEWFGEPAEIGDEAGRLATLRGIPDYDA
jgi:hypothetical protein